MQHLALELDSIAGDFDAAVFHFQDSHEDLGCTMHEASVSASIRQLSTSLPHHHAERTIAIMGSINSMTARPDSVAVPSVSANSTMMTVI